MNKRPHSEILISEKEKRRKDDEAKSNEVLKSFGYSNENNPFGDSKLTEKFVWKKKLKKEQKFNNFESEERRILREEERLLEIESARKKRKEKERQREIIEELKDASDRRREKESNPDWNKQERKFHSEQNKIRAFIRYSQDRATSFDILFLPVLLFHDYSKLLQIIDKSCVDFEAHQFSLDKEFYIISPVNIIEKLNDKDSDHLSDMIREHLGTLVDDSFGLKYWNQVLSTVLCHTKKASLPSNSLSISEKDIETFLNLKTDEELISLVDDIKQNLPTYSDANYWSVVLVIADYALQLRRLFKLLNEVIDLRNRVGLRFDIQFDHPNLFSNTEKISKSKESSQREDCSAKHTQLSQEEKEVQARIEEIHSNLKVDEEIMSPTDEVPISSPKSSIKPKFFVVVKTGVNWSRYNQAHFEDDDTPAPKMIRGYTFNIFYPGLSEAPKFYLEKQKDGDFCIIRFKAPEKFGDVAFRILDREWDKDSFHGYKRVFENGVLTLDFNFKKMLYRK